LTTPTRITIEVHQPEGANGAWSSASGAGDITQVPPIVRVMPAGSATGAPTIVTSGPREEVPSPAAYEPGPCLCLDDEDCGADHAND
jgi:hypothetical protein